MHKISPLFSRFDQKRSARNGNYGVSVVCEKRGNKHERSNFERVKMIRRWSQTLSRRCSRVRSRFTFFSVLRPRPFLCYSSTTDVRLLRPFYKAASMVGGPQFPEHRQRIQKIPWVRAILPPALRLIDFFSSPTLTPPRFNWFRSARSYEKPSSFKVPRFFPSSSVWLLTLEFGYSMFHSHSLQIY